ncbi:glycogen synthase GlgA [Gudongella oleilytica]|uniref:glycogen synthase GlgA n=1 Tax=Gudongella oleilytica TaxID=1582259 RepID=UPI000FF8AE94|nr:glycogen synthase GlgA [Gudongella oleilytica]MDY0255916.1 glycogen synthase GlgA [Gudongella oleilytica]
MRILYAASEVAPYIKTGGLADVAGSLPKAIAKEGHDVFVVLPLYSRISSTYRDRMKQEAFFFVDLDWRHQYAGIFSIEEDGIKTFFIDNEFYFHRDTIYGQGDDGERFLFFSRAIAQMIKALDLKVDIVHANDWHTGLLPLYIKDYSRGDEAYSRIKTVFTIHNLKYQGVFPPSILQLAGLSNEYFHEDGLKFYDAANFMKAGIVYCDSLTTVSESYAEEIRYEFYGENLQGVIRKNDWKLKGIVNGIDYDVYDPEKDPKLPYHYSKDDLRGKALNKEALQRLFDLPENKNVPVIGMVTRLVATKGLDLVRYILDELLQEEVQVVVLGTGEEEYEDMFRHFQWRYPDRLSAHIYFNEGESHLVYAGSDIFMMPSLAEPCGISQLIAMRYGTLPVVRETGGLKDTVKPYNRYTGEGTGFSFANYNAHELLYSLKEAIGVYDDEDTWKSLVVQAMTEKTDWAVSSEKYIKLYEELLLQR